MHKLADISTFESLMNSSSCGRVSSFNEGAIKGKLDASDGQSSQAKYVSVDKKGRVSVRTSSYNDGKWGKWTKGSQEQYDQETRFINQIAAAKDKQPKDLTGEDLFDAYSEGNNDWEWEKIPDKEQIVGDHTGGAVDLLQRLLRMGSEKVQKGAKWASGRIDESGLTDVLDDVTETLRVMAQTGVSPYSIPGIKWIIKYGNIAKGISDLGKKYEARLERENNGHNTNSNDNRRNNRE